MTMTGILRYTRLMTAISLLSLLGACSLIPKNISPGDDTDPPAQATNGETTVAKIIPARQEITPASSIEKNGLAVSYSLKPIPGKYEELLRLTLIFKNQADKGRHIWPHITLVDAKGKRIPAYSLKTLRRITERNTASGQPDQTSSQWADMFWIKRSYRIPPHGIAIGELVYHGKQFSFPLKLSVRIYKDYYRFTAEQ